MAGFPAPGYDGRPRDAAVGVRFHGPPHRPARATPGTAVPVFLGTALCGKPGRAFCTRRKGRCRPVLTSVCSVARLVSSASAARAARDVPAVTLDWAIEPTAWCRAAVKDTWSVVTGPLPARRRSPRAAAASVARDAAAL